MKNQKLKAFFERLRPNRAVYITAVTLVVAVAVLVAITVAANRSKKNDSEEQGGSLLTGPSVTTPAITLPRPAETSAPKTDSREPEATSTAAPTSSASPLALMLPVKGVLISSHDETAQVWSDTMRDYRVHLGVDIATEQNAPVCAAADGVVSQLYEDVRLGYCISVKHADGVYTVYSNLGELAADGIAAGVEVKAGQLIGCVGNSAMVEIAEEPHLHFEVMVDGKSVDPLDFFDKATIASITVDTRYEG